MKRRPPATRRRAAAGFVVAVVLVGALTGVRTAPPAHAVTAGTSGSRLTLVGQDVSVPSGGDLHIAVRVDGVTTPGFTLSVVAHESLDSRSAFDRTLNGFNLGSVLDQVVVGLDQVPQDSLGQHALTIGLEGPDDARVTERLGARRPGVYPLEVDLRDGNDESVGQFVTYLVVTGAAGESATVAIPLEVAWVWPITAAPAVRPDGTTDPAVVAQLRASGRLGRYSAEVAAAAGFPLTLLPGPETIETWAELGRDNASLAQTLAVLQNSGGTGHQILAGPYVPVDSPSLLRANLSTALDDQVAEGNRALQEALGASPDPSTAVLRAVDPMTLSRMQARGVTHVVVESDAIADRSGRETLQQPFTLDAPPFVFLPGGPVRAIAADSVLARVLTTDTAPALRAQQLLAGLSVTALEQPDTPRVVAVVNPDALDPRDGLLATVVAGLRSHPWLTPVTVADAFARVPPAENRDGTPVTRELESYEPPAAPVSQPFYDATTSRVNSFHGLGASESDVTAARRLQLTSVSSNWTGPEAERGRASLSSVNLSIDRFLGKIRVPQPGTITLLEGAREIPITFQNRTGRTVKVLIDLSSPKLSFPEGSSRIVDLPPRNTTISFPVEARTSGSFRMGITVRSTDGVLTIANSNFRIRSQAVSTAGLVLMVGAAAFLALWWGTHIRRRRQRSDAGTTTE